nr:serine/threonine-protein kinase [Corallococcus carmarthensis]
MHPTEASANTFIDGWQVSKALGGGGFAFVFLGEKNSQRRALKVARHREASGDPKQTHARTLREVTTLLMLDHPNIIRPRGYGLAESGNLYLALDYVDGWTLAEWAERKHPSFREVLGVFEKIAGALAYMHRRGILHRDLKLSNVLIRKSDGEPVIIDFGCATHAFAEDLTDGGLPPGTERYRAPEQFQFMQDHKDEPRARYASRVADEIFALGVMLHELLTDPRPTEFRARFDLNSRVFVPPAPRAMNPRVPEGVSDLALTLLSREPARRPVDTEALRRELAELRQQTAAEYDVPVHRPSEQHPAEPAHGGPPAALPLQPTPVPLKRPGALLERPRRRSWWPAGIAVLVALGVVAGLWNESRIAASPPPPSPNRSVPGRTAPPDMSPPSRSPVAPPGPAIDATQKEGSALKTPAPEGPSQGRTPRLKKKPAAVVECAALSLVAALAAGCPGAQLRPESFTCPAEAEEAMREQLHWSRFDRFSLQLDDRHSPFEDIWFTSGDDVVGIRVENEGYPEMMALAPAGTRFYGKAYYLSDKMGRVNGPALVVRYDRVKLPGQDEYPICFVVESRAQAFKDGKVKARNSNTGFVVDRWP